MSLLDELAGVEHILVKSADSFSCRSPFQRRPKLAVQSQNRLLPLHGQRLQYPEFVL